MKNGISFFIVSFLLITISAEECTDSNYVGGLATTGGAYTFGQSFTASCSGYLQYVGFIASASGTCTGSELRVYRGNTTSGDTAYRQTFTSLNAVEDEPLVVELTDTFSIVEGDMYTFEFRSSVHIRFSKSDPYAEGNGFLSGDKLTSFDHNFVAYISDVTTGLVSNQIDETNHSHVKPYKNPGQNQITIDLGNTYNDVSVMIFNVKGKLLERYYFPETHTIHLKATIPKGAYLLKVLSNNDEISSFKIIQW